MTAQDHNLTLQRGEIWLVSFDPQEERELAGSEIEKVRPAVVMSSKGIGRPGLHIVVPFTTRGLKYRRKFWMIPVPKTSENKLSKDTWADASQVKSVSRNRFTKRVGDLEAIKLNEISEAILLCISPVSDMG